MPPIEQDADLVITELERLQRSQDLSRGLISAVVALGIAFLLIADSSSIDWICGSMILIAAAIPCYIWTRRYVLGLPILPTVAAMYFVFFGLPFLTGHPFTKDYDTSEKLVASATVVMVLLIATALWLLLGRTRTPSAKTIRVLQLSEANSPLLVGLGSACLYQFNSVFGIVAFSSEIVGILRAVLLSLGTISVFALGYQLASGRLRGAGRAAFIGGLLAMVFLYIITLYMIAAMELVLVGVLGYFLGGGRVPWKSLVAIFVVLSVLSLGKAEIRSEYWGDDGPTVTSLSDGIALVEKWVGYGIQNMAGSGDASESSMSLLERASSTQLLLRVQVASPDVVPFLEGRTYFAIPGLLIPRIVWPERPTIQETLKELSLQYGLATAEELESVSIGWSLIAEAFANWGFPGCIALGIALGLVTGVSQLWCGRAPVLSARGFAGLLLIIVLLRVDSSAAQHASAWLQSMVPLALLAWARMREVEIVM